MSTLPKCACGCGATVRQPVGKHINRIPRYLKGHGRRNKNWSQKRPPDVPTGICECGCGIRTPICTFTRADRRQYIGHPLPLVPGHKRPEPRDGIRQLSDTEAAYLAGIIDGEGCVHGPRGRSWLLSVINTDVKLIDWLRGIGGTVTTNGARELPRRKVCYSWNIKSWVNVKGVLGQVAKHMLIKRDKAERALADVSAWMSDREERRKPQPKGATRPRKYHTDAERRIANRDRMRKHRSSHSLTSPAMHVIEPVPVVAPSKAK